MRTLIAMLGLSLQAAAAPVQISNGKIFDRQASLLAEGQLWVGVVERSTAPGSGIESTLYRLRSTDGGVSFPVDLQPLFPDGGLRHPSLVKPGTDYLLFFEDGFASANIRLRRAVSSDGIGYLRDAQTLDLGWASGGQARPQIVVGPGNLLTLSYEYLSDGSTRLAQSTDAGLSWDTQQTLTASDASYARLARRASDGRWLLAYQSGTPPRVAFKTTLDPRNWPSSAEWLTPAGSESRRPWPIVQPDGSWVVFYAEVNVASGRTDLWSRRSQDGIQFEAPVAHASSGFAEDFPFAAAGASAQSARLVYSRAVSGCGSSYCWLWLDQEAAVLNTPIWADGFEAGPQ